MKAILGKPVPRGICAVILACILNVNGLIGLYHNTMLFTSGRIADAVIVDYVEEDGEGEDGYTFYSSYDYKFYDQHGVLFHGSRTQEEENPLNIDTENCPCAARVVYLDSDPNINALKMPGARSWVKFMWDSGLLLGIFAVAVYAMVIYQVFRYFFPTERKAT